MRGGNKERCMKAVDLFDKVEAHEELEGVGIKDKTTIVIKHTPSGLKTEVGLEAVTENDWETLEAVLTGQRDIDVLKHMTRVVGYYSTTDNWNKSKLGELKDRQAGNYVVAGA